MDLNKVVLLGNLVKDPAAKTLPAGQTIAYFRVATNHSWKDIKTKKRRDSVEFHSVISWGKLAEIIAKYLKKGSRIYLEGRLKHRQWQDKDGNRQYRSEIIADNLIMLGRRHAKEEKDELAPKNELAKEEVNVEEVKATA